jgi:hypothetical protein
MDNPTLPALLAGALALVGVSWLTPSRTRSFEQVAEALSHEREAIEGNYAGRALSQITPNVTTVSST